MQHFTRNVVFCLCGTGARVAALLQLKVIHIPGDNVSSVVCCSLFDALVLRPVPEAAVLAALRDGINHVKAHPAHRGSTPCEHITVGVIRVARAIRAVHTARDFGELVWLGGCAIGVGAGILGDDVAVLVISHRFAWHAGGASGAGQTVETVVA